MARIALTVVAAIKNMAVAADPKGPRAGAIGRKRARPVAEKGKINFIGACKTWSLR